MKNIIRKFYKKHKTLLWLIGVTIILLLLVFGSLVLFMLNRPEAIVEFAKTSAITKEVLPFSILSIVGMGLGVILTILITIMVIKMFLPNSKSFSSIMLKDEAKFLLDLPSRIGKEVLKNGK